MKKVLILMMLSFILSLILYCEKKHGTGAPLKDYSHFQAPMPPHWAQQGIIYEIYVRAFSREGNFEGVIRRLDDLKKLNVDILWFMPIFPIGEKGRKGTLGSPYAVKDFRAINPEYGTAANFHRLVQEIHKRGMKIILDIVPNHAANDNILTKTHPDWFMRDEKGNFTREVPDWSDVIDFNYDNPDMRRYMQETMLYWIREFDIDGYRCDVAGMVPLDFWKETIPILRQAKPELFLLAEWEDPQLLVAGFNSDYDWTLYHLLKDIRNGKKRTGEAITLIAEKDSLYPKNSLPMRFLENHDEQRSLKIFGVEGINAYAKLIFTLPGIPLIYAGQEIGERQRPSLFEKTTIHWENGDSAIYNLYRTLIEIRKEYSCFTRGSYRALPALMLSGSASAFLREDDRWAAIVVTNLTAKSANQIMISFPEDIKKRLGSMEFVNLGDTEDKRTLAEFKFSNLLPFTTRIYIARKQQNAENN